MSEAENVDREDALKRLKALSYEGGDVERQHSEADDILCDLLRQLGYADVVEAWEEVPKWYA